MDSMFIALAVSNGGKRLGVLGKVVNQMNKATDSLNPAEKRTYKKVRREKKMANLKDKEKEKSFAEHFQPQMAMFNPSIDTLADE